MKVYCGTNLEKLLRKLADAYYNTGTPLVEDITYDILYDILKDHDPTNSFKAYSREFVRLVRIESRSGFEIGIELVSKAHRLRLPIAEIPTIWLDRTDGNSKFLLAKWAPKYLRWFFNCFAPKISKSTQ